MKKCFVFTFFFFSLALPLYSLYLENPRGLGSGRMALTLGMGNLLGVVDVFYIPELGIRAGFRSDADIGLTTWGAGLQSDIQWRFLGVPDSQFNVAVSLNLGVTSIPFTFRIKPTVILDLRLDSWFYFILTAQWRYLSTQPDLTVDFCPSLGFRLGNAGSLQFMIEAGITRMASLNQSPLEAGFRLMLPL